MIEFGNLVFPCAMGVKPAIRLHPLRALVALTLLSAAAPARGFAVFDYSFQSGVDVERTVRRTSRWSATPGGPGLADGIQVAIAPGFADALLIDDLAERAAVDAALLNAFEIWESPGLAFEVTLDGSPVRGAHQGFEIDVMFAPQDDPIFEGAVVGIADVDSFFSVTRTLSNGQVVPGFEITGVDIFIKADLMAAFFILSGFDVGLALFQHLLMHEIGHALGLAHPTDNPSLNLDTDGDPLNPMSINPLFPWLGLMVSTNVDCAAVMVNVTALCNGIAAADLFLHFDDAAGRDVLYPVPEPVRWLQQMVALAGLVAVSRGMGKKGCASGRSDPETFGRHNPERAGRPTGAAPDRSQSSLLC